MSTPLKMTLASDNPGKLREFRELFAPLGTEILPQSDFGVSAVEENGGNFVENALLKAYHAARSSGLPTLGDDSGLIVDALDGAPGLYSARFAGPDASDEDNRRKLLHALAAIPPGRRSARFCCALVLVHNSDDQKPLICEEFWEGHILEAPQGESGFGYDPLFWVDEHACSAAQLEAAQKNRLSHRGKALRSLLDKLSS